MKKLFSLLLALVLVLSLLPGAAAASADDEEPYLRLDADNADNGKGPTNLRLVKGDLFTFKSPARKYQISADYVPDSTGLRELNISGSAEYSASQFAVLADAIRQAAEGRDVYVLDLRQESHGYLNGAAVSWYGTHNWANVGKTLAEVEADEEARLASLAGQTITLGSKKPPVTVDSVMTEKELVTGEGFRYIRIPVTDHTWPKPEQVDEFVDFVKGIDPDRVWIHFHCLAGKGRTSVFMVMYDMMQNPGVSLEDITVRHAMLGGDYLLYTEHTGSYRDPLYEEKAAMTRRFYQYVQENHDSGYALSWSDYLSPPAELLPAA